MALTRNYKKGSIIYFTGDLGKEIYILKSGLVTLTYKGIEDAILNEERLKEGDFFGVKSALGNFRREETAEVKVDSVTFVLSLEEFEGIVSKNINIVLKMLKIFSTQLRKIGKQAELLISRSGEEYTNDVSLFKLGEYYLKSNNFEGALYALHKYLEHYPNAGNSYEAHKYIDMIRQKDEGFILKKSAKIKEDYTKNPKDSYNEAIKAIETKDYDKALAHLSDLEKLGDDTMSSEELSRRAPFKKIFSYFKMGKYKETIAMYTNFIKENPKTPYMKEALFYIGISYKELNQKDKALGFLRKVSSMGAQDDISRLATSFISKL